MTDRTDFSDVNEVRTVRKTVIITNDVTLTATVNSDSIDVPEWAKHAFVSVAVSGVSGSTPTLVPEIEVSPDDTSFHHRHTIIDPNTEGDLTRTTAPTVEGKIQDNGEFEAFIDYHLGVFLRLLYTIGGTTPAFTVTTKIVFTG